MDTVDRFLAAQQNVAPPAPAPEPSVLGPSLRSGGYGTAAQLEGVAGQIGEGVSRFANRYDMPNLRNSAAAFTANQRAAAVADQQQAAAEMQGIPTSIGEVHTLRDFGRYATGKLGQSVPMVGAGVAGAALGALAAPELAGAGLLGATALTTPLTAGDQFNAQQADPVQAAQPYGLRTRMGAGVGAAQAGMMNVVPAAVVGKLAGKAAGAAALPFKQALAQNVAEAMGGNAAAGMGSEAIGQEAASALNPQRDTSGDAAQLLESGVGGAVLGAPFAALGTAGSMRGAPNPATRSVVAKIRDAAQAATDKAADSAKAATDSVAGAAKSGADKVKDIFSSKQENQAAQDIAAGDTDGLKTINPQDFATASPEAQAVMTEGAKKTRLEQVQQMAQELYNDKTLSPESRAALDAMQGDFSDAANSMKVAAMALGQKAAKAGGDAINSLSDWVNEQRAKGDGTQQPPTKSEFSPEITGVVKDTVVPFLEDHNPALLANPDAINKLADSLRYVMNYMSERSEDKDALPPHVLDHLTNVFGGAAPRVLHELTTALSPDDQVLMRKVNAISETESLGANRARAIAKQLGEDTVNRYQLSNEDLRTIGDALAAHADNSAYKHMGAEERTFQQRHFEDTLAQQFGDDTANKLLTAAAKDAEKRSRDSVVDEDAAPAEDDSGVSREPKFSDEDMSDAERNDTGLEHSTAYGDTLADQYAPTTYHGEGADNRMVRTPEAWRAYAQEKGYDQSKPAPADVLLDQIKNGPGRDRNVDFVPFHQLPDDLRQAHFDRIRAAVDGGMSEEQALAKYGDPNEIGMVRAEGMKQEGRLSPEDMDHVSVDTSLPGHKDNPSRIVTGVRGASIDALRLVRMFDKRMPYNRTDEQGRQYRLARVFLEGIASVQDHLGKSFDVPDSTVVKLGNPNAKPPVRSVTWGQLKRLSMLPHDAGREPGEFTQFLQEAKPHELRHEASRLQELVDQKAAQVREQIETLKQAGVRLDKATIKRLYADAHKQDPEQSARLLQRVQTALDEYGKKPLAEDLNVQEVDPASEIHLARAGAGAKYEEPFNGGRGDEPAPLTKAEDALVVKHDLSGQPIQYGGRGKDVTDNGKRLEEVISKLENAKGVGAQALGKKARELDNYFDTLSRDPKQDKVEKGYRDRFGAEMIKAKKMSDVSGLINNYHARLADRMAKMGAEEGSQWKGSQAKKPDAFVQQALAGGEQTAKVVRRVATSTDAPAMARALKTLLAHPEQNEHSARVVKALNDRIGELAHADPDTALNLTRAPGEPRANSAQRATGAAASPAVQADVKAHLEKVLGPDVHVEFAKLLHAGDYQRAVDAATGKLFDHIRLSLHSLDPLSTAFHESLHGFIRHMQELDQHGVNKALYKAADSFVMRGKLEKLLAGQPEALEQMRTSTEERAAYMYQFYHTRDPLTGKRLLEVNEAPATVLGKIAGFIRNTLGIWSNDQRAVHIMDYLHSGEYAKNMGDRNAVAHALLERGTNQTFEGIKKALAPLTRIATNVLAGGHAALADLHNPAIDQILGKIYSPGTAQAKDPGWIVAHRAERTAVLNGLMNEFAKRGTTAEQLQQATQQLQSGVKAASPEARLLAHQNGPIRQLLDRMHQYMTDAGVNVNDLGVGKDYFPVVYDTSYIASHSKEWRAMLDKYVRRGQLTSAAADAVTAKLLANDGNTFGATDMPGMQYLKERKLDFLDPKDRAPFVQKDLLTTLNSYVTQATRRAEWARRFGADNGQLNALTAEAHTKHGATKEDIAQLQNYIRGVDGTLGDDISPNLRRIFGNAIVYQNVRLLPMAVFSMAVDPMGIVVRGGTMRDAFNAFKRGVSEIPRGFQKNPKADPWYDLSRLVGTIDDTALVHTLGTSFSQGMVGDTGRKINDMYFKYNLVEQMNTSMRVAALPAALGFMARHAADANAHSPRYLAELGLTKSDVIMNKAGDRPLVTRQEFLDHGMSEAQATAASLKMRNAINKWVDGAVLRPNAAQKPTWSNDPHWALVSHLKQFVYAFHDTILKRVVTEAKHGNYTPAMALASYVPIMMAADFVKGMILGGGSQPDYKKDWGFGDYVGAGMQRAGLFSVGQFGIDAMKDIRFGGTGLGPLLGPQLEQIGDGLRLMGGRDSIGNFVSDALPASVLTKAVGHFGEAKSDPNFSD